MTAPAGGGEAHPAPGTYVELDDPQERDEEQVKGHKEAEGATHVGDGLALRGGHEQVRGRERQGGGVGGIQGGGDGQAAPQLPVVSDRHPCGEAGISPCNKGRTEIKRTLASAAEEGKSLGNTQTFGWNLIFQRKECVSQLFVKSGD